MKKVDLYKLFITFPELKNEILQNLENIAEIKDKDSDLFIKTCINNKNSINEETFEELVQVYYKICYLNSEESKIKFDKMLNEFLENDFINSSEYLRDIFNTLSNLLIIPIDTMIEEDSENGDFYILKFAEYYLNLFNSFNYDNLEIMDELYDKNIEKISSTFINLIYMLEYTEVDNEEDFTKNCLIRLELFSRILSNKEIMLLNNEKYESVSKVLLSINNIYELAKFEKRIIIFNDDISDNEFKEKIENYSKELNENTIDLIKEKLNYQEKFGSIKPGDEKVINDELKKILCPEKNNKIIKF